MKHIMGKGSTSSLSNGQEGDIQPNATDLRLDRVFKINTQLFTLCNDLKDHRGSVEIQPDTESYFNLTEGHYEVVMENTISVGEGEAGWVITRSTLNRNGLFLTSGLYDSGYSGPMMAVLHVNCGAARIKKGTRVGQYISFDAEMLHAYDGSYGFDRSGQPKPEHQKLYGIGKSHDQKYGA